MSQSFIPAVFYRGGTSKGVFFHAHDLPAGRDVCDRIFLAAIGSPDPYGRQLNGMGGGISSLSKAVVIGPPTHPEADVDYTFIQLAVEEPVADWSNNCGNLSSAVGHFAVDEGLVPAKDGEVLVRIHQTNTKKIIHSRFAVQDGKAATAGDYGIAGVAGTGSRIRLDFLAPGGAVTGKLLPTGNVVDWIDLGADGKFEVSIIDATSPIVYVDAQSAGLVGSESPNDIEAQPRVMSLLEKLRRQAGVMIGLANEPAQVGLQTPRIALAAHAAPFKKSRRDKLPGAGFRHRHPHDVDAACAPRRTRHRRSQSRRRHASRRLGSQSAVAAGERRRRGACCEPVRARFRRCGRPAERWRMDRRQRRAVPHRAPPDAG